MRLPATTAALLLATSSGCGPDPEPRVVDQNDTTPPSKVAMDSHVPRRSGGLEVVTVSTTSGNKAIALDNLADIALIAVATDDESAISGLEITGAATVHCLGPNGGRSTQSVLGTSSGGGEEPVFTRHHTYNLELAKQSANDTEFIGKCPPDTKLTSIEGSLLAIAENGVGLELRTGRFSFSWQRPS